MRIRYKQWDGRRHWASERTSMVTIANPRATRRLTVVYRNVQGRLHMFQLLYLAVVNERLRCGVR